MSADDQVAAGVRQAAPWDHARSSFHSLNVRSIRLAIVLGVSLGNPRDVEQVFHRPTSAPPALERRLGTERRGGARAGRGPDRRVAHQWEELRGLLVLRYGVQKRCLEDFGIDVTRRLLAEVQAELQREGFAPESTGIELERRVDAA
jgi:hypothetical protein